MLAGCAPTRSAEPNGTAGAAGVEATGGIGTNGGATAGGGVGPAVDRGGAASISTGGATGGSMSGTGAGSTAGGGIGPAVDRGGAASISTGGATGGSMSNTGAGSTAGGTGAGSTAGGTGAAGGAGVGGSSDVAGAPGDPKGGSGGTGTAGSGSGGATTSSPLESAQRAFVDLRFGMFIHFGILTYTGKWAQPNLDITLFNPTKLNPAQWAEAAASAHMTFGVLTTRHHDGFALWPSKAGSFNVGHIPWMNSQGDVVKAYVDAFRAKGLQPGLYYSIWDATEGIGNSATITTAQVDYVKQQITELLTNYGPIPILVLDGYSWKTGHKAFPYEQIRALVKSIQPDCLITDHTHLNDPYDVDVVMFEEPQGSFAPAGNTYPGIQGQKINGSGGNDWFWAPDLGGLLTQSAIVDQHLKLLEPRWTNFLLNCPPNRDGLLDDAIVSRLREVGAAWNKNVGRAPLPAQGAQLEYPYTPVNATATSGTAANAIDGKNDNWNALPNTIWRTTGAFPQSITLDLGATKPDVGMLGYVPEYMNNAAQAGGNITSYRILVSTDANNFTEVTSGTWAADAKMKVATFGPAPARYVRLEVRAANGTSASATEISIGARR
jgi:alpha-L-fucosidase